MTNARGTENRRRDARALPALAATIPSPAVWVAVAATVITMACWLLKQREARKNSTFVDREVTYFLMTLSVLGFAAGCWAFVLYMRFSA